MKIQTKTLNYMFLACSPDPTSVSFHPAKSLLEKSLPGSTPGTATLEKDSSSKKLRQMKTSSQTSEAYGISPYASATCSCKKKPSLFLVSKSLLFPLSPLSLCTGVWDSADGAPTVVTGYHSLLARVLKALTAISNECYIYFHLSTLALFKLYQTVN